MAHRLGVISAVLAACGNLKSAIQVRLLSGIWTSERGVPTPLGRSVIWLRKENVALRFPTNPPRGTVRVAEAIAPYEFSS